MSFDRGIRKPVAVRSYVMPVLTRDTEGEGPRPSVSKDPEAVEREAFERGYAAGEKAGMEMAEQKAAVLLEHLERLLQEIQGLKEQLLEELEPQLLFLALTVARKVIHGELETRPDLVVNLIREGVKKMEAVGPLTVKVPPALYDFLGERRERLQAEFPGLRFESDPKAPPGGAVVRSPSQEVRTDPDFLLSHLVEALRNPG